jgi:hypothetical protein
MSEVMELPAAENNIPRTPKDKSCLLDVMCRYLKACGRTGAV